MLGLNPHPNTMKRTLAPQADEEQRKKAQKLTAVVVPYKKREKLFVDSEGRDWSDIFWRTGRHGFACPLDEDYKGFTSLSCARWMLPKLEICPCPIGYEKEPLVNKSISSAVCRMFWFPEPCVCKKKWLCTTLWRVPENCNIFLKSPHAKPYRVVDSDVCWGDYRYGNKQQHYAPLSNNSVKQLTPQVDADNCFDNENRKLIKFSHEK